MAKKYKISKLRIIKPIGYSDGAGNEVTTGTLNITPEPGYSVVAGDFSITKLPPQIESVVFTNTSTVVTSHGDADNKVVATFTFKKDFVVTEGNIKIVLPIKGVARRLSRAIKQTTSWKFNVSRKHSAANYGWGVYPLLTTRKLTSLETNDVLSTIRPDYKESIIKGYGDPNVKEQALWFYMSPSAGYKFAKKPYLKITNPVSDKIKIHTVDSSESGVGYPNLFSVVLYVTAKEDVNFAEGVDIEFVCETIAKKVETQVINAISVGSDRVGTLGGTKTININATRGSEFKIVATRRSTGKSILMGTNSTHVDPIYGSTPDSTARSIRCVRNGVYSVEMKIPPSVILVTKMNGTISGGSTLTLDSVSGVMKDDKITTLDKKQIDSATLRKVLSVNTSTKQVTLDGNVDIADDKKVVFTRSDKYDVDVIPSEFSQTVFSSNIPEKQISEDGREYLYTINQDNPPTLSFTWSKGSLGGTITLPSTVTAAGKINATARDSRITSSSAMVNTNELGQFRINVIFKIAHPNGFATPSQPLFSNTDSAASHWTNSLPSSNGGTKVTLFNIQATRSTTSTTNDTISMTIYGQIKKWGNTDVAMDFELDQITAIYTP